MRRERKHWKLTGGLAALLSVIGCAMAVSPIASAASPQEICAAIQAGTAGTYSQADVDAYNAALQNDPSIQGYCSPLPVTPPVSCVYTGSNGVVTTTTATSGSCTPPPCVYVAPNGETVTTPADTLDQNGNYVCAPQPPPPSRPTAAPAAVPAAVPAAAKPVAQVAGAQKTLKPAASVAPAQKTHRSAAAPLASTKTAGTLPFTGAQLALFAVVGSVLLLGGVLLRTTARRKDTRA